MTAQTALRPTTADDVLDAAYDAFGPDAHVYGVTVSDVLGLGWAHADVNGDRFEITVDCYHFTTREVA